MQIYVHRNNQQLGPFTEADIKAQLAAGTIALSDHVWWQGQPSWMPLGQTTLVGPIAPPAPGIPPVPQPIGAIHPHATQSSQLAVWSLVCACLTFLCGIFTLIPAIILGHMSLSEIKKNPGMQGRGMAIAGLVISYVLVAICILVLVAIMIFAALGNNVQEIFKTITSQLSAEQASNSNSDDSTTNTDQTTNAPDQSTNTPTATPTTNSDQPTATPTTTDQSTNSADSSTNAAPASQ